jgi:hypothetical protein
MKGVSSEITVDGKLINEDEIVVHILNGLDTSNNSIVLGD